MLLNRDDIANENIVENPKDDHFRTASYDVSIGEVIGPDGQSHNSLVISPQQMVMVVSAEHLTLPEHIAGYAMPKTSLSNAGILALSTGIIDPQYDGKVSSILINFGQAPHLLQEGDSFLRLSFHRFNRPAEITPAPSMSDEEYIKDRRDIATRLPDTFLDVSRLTSTVAERVGAIQQGLFANFIGRGSVILAGAALIFALITFVGAPIVDAIFTHTAKEAAVREVRSEEIAPLRQDVAELKGQVEVLQAQGTPATGQTENGANQPPSANQERGGTE